MLRNCVIHTTTFRRAVLQVRINLRKGNHLQFMVSVIGLTTRRFNGNVNGNRTIRIRTNEVYLRRYNANVGISGRPQRIISLPIRRTVNIIYQISNCTSATTRIMYCTRFAFPRIHVSFFFLARNRCTCNSATGLGVPFNCRFLFKHMSFGGFPFFKLSIRVYSNTKGRPQIGALW